MPTIIASMPMPTNSDPALLHCEHIVKTFNGFSVLSNVGFSIQPNEILGIIGPNGAGKTTLMECLAGLLPWDNGTMLWQGKPLSPLDADQALFYLPDGILPYPDDRVGRVLRFFQHAHAASDHHHARLVEHLQLEPVLEKRVRTLSKGYRRRLLLAIGLLSHQPLLLLDEPFDGFDLRQALGVMDLLRQTLSGRALLLSIHQLSEAEKICDRYLLLNNGRVAACGSLDALRQQAGVSSGCLEEVFLALV